MSENADNGAKESTPVDPIFSKIWRFTVETTKPEDIEEIVEHVLETAKEYTGEDIKYLKFLNDITTEQQTAFLRMLSVSRFAGAVSPLETLASLSAMAEGDGNKEMLDAMIDAGHRVLVQSAKVIQDIVCAKGGE